MHQIQCLLLPLHATAIRVVVNVVATADFPLENGLVGKAHMATLLYVGQDDALWVEQGDLPAGVEKQLRHDYKDVFAAARLASNGILLNGATHARS